MNLVQSAKLIGLDPWACLFYGLPFWLASLTCWNPHLRSLGRLVGALVVLELMWGWVSLVMLALFFDAGLPTSAGLMEAAVNTDNLDFVAVFVVASGFFAMLVFPLSVVSTPCTLSKGRTRLMSPSFITFGGTVLTHCPSFLRASSVAGASASPGTPVALTRACPGLRTRGSRAT
jgi:Predicted integral membrane protein (DUF2189)